MSNTCCGCQLEIAFKALECAVSNKKYCLYCARYYLVPTKEHGLLDLSLWEENPIVIDKDELAFPPPELIDNGKI